MPSWTNDVSYDVANFDTSSNKKKKKNNKLKQNGAVLYTNFNPPN